MAFTEQELLIIQFGKENGKTIAEQQRAVENFRAGITVKKSQPQPVQREPTFMEEVGESLDVREKRFAQITGREDTGVVEKATQVFGQGAGLASDVIEGAVEKVPGVKQAFGALGSGIQWLATSDFSPIKKLGDQIGKSKFLQETTALYDEDQNFKDSVDAVANIARLGGDVQLASDAVGFSKNVIKKIQLRVGEGVLPPGGAGTSGVDDIFNAAKDLRTKAQMTLAEKTVNPQLKASAERLFAEGTKRLENPLATYEKHLAQSKLSAGDIKVDPAISVVGEEIGNQFGSVVKMRRGVGEVIGAELKKVGGVKTNLVGAVDDFVAQLGDSGVVYDRVTKTVTPKAGQIKFAAPEIKLIEQYAKELQLLGTSPTIAEIDAFVSRMSSELDLYKASNNITSTTNSERIIKGSMAKLREQFNPKVSGNLELQKLYDAKQTYAELTGFIKEGEKFLGKLTQSGDYARDASLAKSSVQSVLNNGKKDWLLQLEALTGYQATDEAVLALQAMKDAGDFRGLSLLQAMSEGSIPASKLGFLGKLLDFGIEKGKGIVLGSPEEQTRVFLKSLSVGE